MLTTLLFPLMSGIRVRRVIVEPDLVRLEVATNRSRPAACTSSSASRSRSG